MWEFFQFTFQPRQCKIFTSHYWCKQTGNVFRNLLCLLLTRFSTFFRQHAVFEPILGFSVVPKLFRVQNKMLKSCVFVLIKESGITGCYLYQFSYIKLNNLRGTVRPIISCTFISFPCLSLHTNLFV